MAKRNRIGRLHRDNEPMRWPHIVAFALAYLAFIGAISYLRGY